MESLYQWNRQEIDGMSDRYRVQFINSLPGFKTPFLVGTQNNQKQTNLAIVSSVTHLGSNPPLMALVMRPNSVPRHTIENIKESSFYTLNAVNIEDVKKAHQTAARYPREISEFSACGFTEEWHDELVAPFVLESRLKIGLKLIQIIPLDVNGCDLVIGEILLVKAPRSIVGDDGSIDAESASIASVSGLDRYHKTQKLMRLTYAKPDSVPQEID